MGLLDQIHDRSVYGRRIRVLADHMAEMLPAGARVLDVGCGDGQLDALILSKRPDVTIEGIDILVRPRTAVPVTKFDGANIPFPNKSFDVVQFVDVLHHAEDPTTLLREAARVASNSLLIKDHTRDSPVAGPVLRFMDWVGNERHGVVLPYTYWSSNQWMSAFRDLGLKVAEDRRILGIYPAGFDLIFGRGLHLLIRLQTGGGA